MDDDRSVLDSGVLQTLDFRDSEAVSREGLTCDLMRGLSSLVHVCAVVARWLCAFGVALEVPPSPACAVVHAQLLVHT